jgi:PTS system ascorbate-specific IIA component
MVGILVVAHGALAASLVAAVTHVLGTRPPHFEAFAVDADDDPLALLPTATQAVAAVDSGDGVVVFCDLYGASPCNLALKLVDRGRVEVIAGVNLPMLVRTFTYRDKGMETIVRKAVSGGCEGVLHV